MKSKMIIYIAIAVVAVILLAKSRSSNTGTSSASAGGDSTAGMVEDGLSDAITDWDGSDDDD